MSVETKTGLVRRFLWSDVVRQDCFVRLFLCFCIFAPFDTARRSDGTGRLFDRRRIGYWGEQNGRSIERGGSRAVFCAARLYAGDANLWSPRYLPFGETARTSAVISSA